MKKNIISKSISIIMALMISVLTVSTSFAAMPNGTVVIGSKAFDLAYANDPANITEITNAVVAGGAVYIKNFNGSWVENNTGLTVTVIDIPAVVYKNTTGVSTNFNAGDKDIVTTPTPAPAPSSGSSGSGSGGYNPGEVKSTPTVNAAIAATTVSSGQTLEHSTLSGTFKNTSNVAVTGILAWDIPATIVTTTGSFPWTFTPTDITKYNVVKGNVTVSVAALVNAVTPVIITDLTVQNTNVGTSVTLDATATVTDGGTVSYAWYSATAADKTGATAIVGQTSATYTLEVNVSGIFYYYCVVTNINNAATGNKAATITSAVAAVTVNALVNAVTPVITTDLTSKNTNVGTAVSLDATATVADAGTVSYAWYRATAADKTGVTAIVGATSATYDPAVNVAGTFYYYCVVTNTNNAATGTKIVTATSAVSIVTVNALVNAVTPVITTDLTAQNTNVGTSATLDATATVTDGGTVSYAWYSATAADKTGATAIVGQTSATYTPEVNVSGIFYYYCVVTNINNAATGNKAATITSAVAAVTVNALVNAVAPIITTDLTAQNTNVGTSVTLDATAATVTDPGTVSYAWYRATAADKTGATAIVGAISETYEPAVNVAGTFYYYCVVTNTNNAATGIKTATATSTVSIVTVNALVNAVAPVITTDLTAQNTNVEAAVTLDATAIVTDAGTVSYAWYRATAADKTGATAIVGATSETYEPAVSVAGTFYYYCLVTNTNNAATGIKTATAISAVSTVTVNALVNAVAPIITTDLTAQNTNVGTSVTLDATATVTDAGTVSYAWYSATAADKTGATVIGGATSVTYTPAVDVAGTFYYYCVVTNTNNAATGTKIVTVTSAVSTVTVNELVNAVTPVITTDLTAKNTNVGTAVSLNATATVTDAGTVSYAWYRATAADKTGAAAIVGQISATYDPAVNVVGTFYYYCVVTNTNNAATGIKTATAISAVSTVTVNALVNAVTPVITTDLTVKNTNVGTSVSLNATATVTDAGTVSYAWYSATAADKTGAAVIAGQTSATYTPAVDVAGTFYYYCVVTNTNNVATGTKIVTATSAVSIVTVNALVNAVAPVITTDLTAKNTNVGTAVSLNATATVTDGGTVSYAWYSATAADKTGATAIVGQISANYDPAVNVVGTFYYYCVVTNTNNAATGTNIATKISQVSTVTVSVAQVAPTFTSATISGTAEVDRVLSASGIGYADANGDVAGTPNYQWQICDTVGGTYIDISGATQKTYTLVVSDASKFIRVMVTPVAVTGILTGTAVISVATVVSLGKIVGTAEDMTVTLNVDNVTTQDGDVFVFTLSKGTLKDIAGLSAVGSTNVITFSSLPAGMTYTVANAAGKLVVTFNHAANTAILKDVSMGAVIKEAAVTSVGALDSNDIYVTLQKMIYTSLDGYYKYQLNGTNAVICQYIDTNISVTVPSQIDGKTVTDIGSFAFNQKNLTEVTIPNNVKIDTYAFINNNIASITIGSNVTIGDNFLAFGNSDFRNAYASGGAGTYIGTQNGAWTKAADLISVVYDNGDINVETDDKIILTFSKSVTFSGNPSDYLVVYAHNGQCDFGVENSTKVTLDPNNDYTVSLGHNGTVEINITQSGFTKTLNIISGIEDEDLKIKVLNTGNLTPIINPSASSLIIDDAGAQVSVSD